MQGTINGFGERCGNANLCSVIPNLQIKLGFECVSEAQLKGLATLSRTVYELANIEPYKRQPYVGASAFAHKGGLHVAAVQKNAETYEHIKPELVGNRQRVLVSDLSGRSSVVYKAKQFGLDVDTANPAVKTVLDRVKQLESSGFQYEGAEASFELLIQEALHGKVQHFKLVAFRVSDEKSKESEPPLSEASVMIVGPDGSSQHTVARGNGPLNALDLALRKALLPYYPQLKSLELHDYKVRVLGGGEGTEATVRVLIESGDESGIWGTVGVSPNVIDASWQALVDSFEYKLYKDEKEKAKAAARGGMRPRGRRRASPPTAGRAGRASSSQSAVTSGFIEKLSSGIASTRTLDASSSAATTGPIAATRVMSSPARSSASRFFSRASFLSRCTCALLVNAIASISPARELDDELDRLRILGGRRVHVRRHAIGIDAALGASSRRAACLDPQRTAGRRHGHAAARSSSAPRSSPSVVGSAASISASRSSRRSARRGFGPRVSLRVRRRAAMKSASMPTRRAQVISRSTPSPV